jgi:zinc and cadmium transporter
MIFLAILLGTLTAGIGSVWVAAWLSYGVMSRYTQHMLSLAAGALLATSFMHLLPEAFESAVTPRDLFLTLLLGLVFFFLLDKAELWHHGHEHGAHAHSPADHHHAPAASAADAHADAQDHSHAYHHGHAPTGGSWAVLAGDSGHCFGDGILIASAFMADVRLGAIAALAVLAHEVPHHMGDLVVLREGSDNRKAAIVKVSMAGAVTALGGTVGYVLVDALHDFLPYFLVVASSSFIYVALADLIPQLQKRLSAKETAAQIIWLVGGMAMVMAVSQLAHRA